MTVVLHRPPMPIGIGGVFYIPLGGERSAEAPKRDVIQRKKARRSESLLL